MDNSEDYLDAYPEALALRDFSAHCATLLGDVQNAQNVECPAAKEQVVFSDPEFLKVAFSQGALLSVLATDQVESLVRSFTSPVLTLSPWSITRNILEASAIASWLLDLEIDAPERASRGCAFRYEGLSQQVKAARAMKHSTASAEAALDRLEKSARSLDFPIHYNKKGKRIGMAQIMPSVTNLVRDTLGEEAAYRLFSAAVHGHYWALIQLGFKHVGPAGSQTIGGVMQAFTPSMPHACVQFSCLKSGVAIYELFKNKAIVFGVDHSALKAPFESFRREAVVQERIVVS